jgi:hypothetical protein
MLASIGYVIFQYCATMRHRRRASQETTHRSEQILTQVEEYITHEPTRSSLVTESSSDLIAINFFGQKVALTPFPQVYMSSAHDPDDCYKKSYRQASDEFLVSLLDIFDKLGIADSPYAQLLFLIELFSTFTTIEKDAYYTAAEILSKRTSNTLSNVIASVAVMNRLGWDIQCFYNETKTYLGVHFTDDWEIKKEIWIVEHNKKYHFKEFNTYTPAGEVLVYDPHSQYFSLQQRDRNLRPLPCLIHLPYFGGASYTKKLQWEYNDTRYSLTISIPHEQIHFADNLPRSLYGAALCGKQELHNIGLSAKLQYLTQHMDEYDKVNFLLKFCHSDKIFTYDSGQQIKSISRQLLEGKNDCDGRSVFLYSLLMSVLGYSSSEILFVQWSKHLALALKPRAISAQKKLSKHGAYVGDKFYILDPTYTGDTFWGSQMPTLPHEFKIINYNP